MSVYAWVVFFQFMNLCTQGFPYSCFGGSGYLSTGASMHIYREGNMMLLDICL